MTIANKVSTESAEFICPHNSGESTSFIWVSREIDLNLISFT